MNQTKQTVNAKTITLVVILFILFAMPFIASATQSEAVKVLSTKRYIFYFKADKRFIGGTVEIFDDHQHLVGTEKIVEVKTIVDFFNLREGNYTIKITQGDEELVYEYLNAK